MNPSLIRKLEGLIERHEEVQAMLGEPDVVSDQDRYRALTREYAQLEDIVHAFQRYRQAQDDLETTQMMLEEDDADLREMAQEELPLAKANLEALEQELQLMLCPYLALAAVPTLVKQQPCRTVTKCIEVFS